MKTVYILSDSNKKKKKEEKKGFSLLKKLELYILFFELTRFDQLSCQDPAFSNQLSTRIKRLSWWYLWNVENRKTILLLFNFVNSTGFSLEK